MLLRALVSLLLLTGVTAHADDNERLQQVITDFAQMQEALNQHLDLEGQDPVPGQEGCNIQQEDLPPIQMGDSEIPQFRMTIRGADCPFHAEIFLLAEESSEIHFTANYGVSIVALTPETIAEFKFRNATIEGLISGGITQEENAPLEINFTVGLSGSADSVTEGPFSFTSEQSQRMVLNLGGGLGGLFEIVPENKTNLFFQIFGTDKHEFHLNGETTRLNSETAFGTENDYAIYKINGEDVTEEEYQHYLQHTGIPGYETGPGGPGGPGGDDSNPHGLMCEINYYSPDDISLEEIQNAINSGMPVFAMPIAWTMSSTSEVSMEEVNGVMLITEVKFRDDLVTVTTKFNDPESEPVATLYAPADSASRSATELPNGWLLEKKCQIPEGGF